MVLRKHLFSDFLADISRGVNFPEGFKKFWGSVSGLFSFCFSCWFKTNASSIANAIYIVECIVAIIVFICFYLLQKKIQPEDSVSGLETIAWNMISACKCRYPHKYSDEHIRSEQKSYQDFHSHIDFFVSSSHQGYRPGSMVN